MSLLCATTALAAGDPAQPTASAAMPSSQTALTAPSGAIPEDLPTALAAIDIGKKADIQRLIVAAGMKDVMSCTLDAMQGNIRSALIANLPPGDCRETLADFFVETFRANLDLQQLIDIATVTYDRYLPDDIKGLTQFYQTPLGQKTTTVVPNIVSAMQMAGEQLREKVGKESMQEVLAEHPDLAKALDDASQRGTRLRRNQIRRPEPLS